MINVTSCHVTMQAVNELDEWSHESGTYEEGECTCQKVLAVVTCRFFKDGPPSTLQLQQRVNTCW